jgi:hypothetical protein
LNEGPAADGWAGAVDGRDRHRRLPQTGVRSARGVATGDRRRRLIVLALVDHHDDDRHRDGGQDRVESDQPAREVPRDTPL